MAEPYYRLVLWGKDGIEYQAVFSEMGQLVCDLKATPIELYGVEIAYYDGEEDDNGTVSEETGNGSTGEEAERQD